jgi:cell division protein FtsN
MATRDYKARERATSRRGRRESSGFFWFVTGAVLGGFGVGLAWMLQDRLPTPAEPSPPSEARAPTKPRFDFHQILPEMEVLVPDEELSTAALPPPKPPTPTQQREQEKPASPKRPKPKPAAKPEKPAPATDGTSYLVQVASLRQSADAERLKAKLALLGVQARIQRVTVNGKAYYRVRAGPFKGKQEVNKTRSLLSSKGLESITVKLK